MPPEQLCALIPHSGEMCLLDELVTWDTEHLVCRTVSHRSPSNPLRQGDRLATIHAIEYAGQAAALHGALLSQEDGRGPARGLLVAVSRVELLVTSLSALTSPLEIQVARLHGVGTDAIYAYRITSGSQPVSTGRLTILTAPAEPR